MFLLFRVNRASAHVYVIVLELSTRNEYVIRHSHQFSAENTMGGATNTSPQKYLVAAESESGDEFLFDSEGSERNRAEKSAIFKSDLTYAIHISVLSSAIMYQKRKVSNDN